MGGTAFLFLVSWAFTYRGCVSFQVSQYEGSNWFGYGCPPHATGQFPFAEDCKKFYNCFKGRGQLSVCAPGTLFNPATLECDFPDKVACIKGRHKGYYSSSLTQDSYGLQNHHHDHSFHNPQYHATAGQYVQGGGDQWSGEYHQHYHTQSQGYSTLTQPHQKGHYVINSKTSRVFAQTPAVTYHSGVQPPGTLIAIPARELRPPNYPSRPQPFYPSQAQPGGYSSQPLPQQPAGYPTQQQPGGYPTQQQPRQPAGYPTQQQSQQPRGYPSQPLPQLPAGYPPQQPVGYPSQQPAGYPSQQQPQQPAVYPSQQQPQQPRGYPSQSPPHVHYHYNPQLQQPSQYPSVYPVLVFPQTPYQQPNNGYFVPVVQQPAGGRQFVSSVSEQSSSQSSHGYSVPSVPQSYVPLTGPNYPSQGSVNVTGPQQVFITNSHTLSQNERSDFEKKFETLSPQPTIVYNSYGSRIGTGFKFPDDSSSSGSYPIQGTGEYPPNQQSGYGSSDTSKDTVSVIIPPLDEDGNEQGVYSSSRGSEGGYSSTTISSGGNTNIENPNPIFTEVKPKNEYSNNNICPSGFQGIMPHSDCTKFLSCANGRTFVMECGPGTRFHPNILNCVHAHEVECGVSHSDSSQDLDAGSTRVHDLDTEGTKVRTSIYTHHVKDGKDYRIAGTEEPGQHEVDEESGQHEVDEEPVFKVDKDPGQVVEEDVGQKVEDPGLSVDEEPGQIEVTEDPVEYSTTEKKPEVTFPPLKPTVTINIDKQTIHDRSGANTKQSFRPESITDSRPVEHIPKSISKRNSTTDKQILRLRGSPTQFEGFVEMQLSPGSWGIVCDKPNKWKSEEAHIVCNTLGFPRGAELTWQGLPAEVSNTTSEILAADEVICTGEEESILECTLNVGNGCKPEKDGIWVRCYGHGQSRCHPGEMSLGDKCYALVIPSEDVPTEHLVGFTQGEAIAHCQKNGGHLLDITSQLENDFVSEWLLRQNIDGNIMTSGVGMSLMGGTIWIWEGSESTFTYHNWWPGWKGVKAIPPQAGSRAKCIVMRRHFPCQETNYGEDKLCDAQYYYWDLEDCDSMSNMLPYVCERPANNIGCVVGTGTSYKGAANVTQTGKTCLDWESKDVLPELKYKISESDRKMTLSGHNYCRNVAGKETHPWCYVKDGENIKKDLCDIPICSKAIEKSARYFQCPENHFSCGLNGECIPSNKVCDGEFDCSNSNDEVGCTKQKNEEQIILVEFEVIEQKKLAILEIELFVETPLLDCAKKCLERVNCRSFSYMSGQKLCLLSESNIGLSGALASEPDWNYYEVKSKSLNCASAHVCDNGKCVANETVCNGRNDCGDNSDEKDCSWLKQSIQIRLTGSSKPNEGTIEVKARDNWGLVCDDDFDMKDADVVCRHLGYPLGALEIKKHSFFKPNHTTSFLIDNLSCKGNESSVADCHHNGWGIHDCRDEEYNSIDYVNCSNKAAGVICKVTTSECKFNYWQCQTSTECIPLGFLCDNVKDCADSSDEDPTRCQAPVEIRLVGIGGESRSNKVTEGRVEVKRFGIWGTVCDDDFGPKEAEVVCNSLGFKGAAQAYKEAAYGAGDGVIWLDQVHCLGNESHISDCMTDAWGQTNCRHNEDVSVSCSPQKLNMPSKDVKKIEKEVNTQNVEVDLDDIFYDECGKLMDNLDIVSSDFAPRVVSGFETIKGTYPWQATVRIKSVSGKSSHWCGAVVVSRLHVITAGHCLRDYIKAAYFIRVGDYDNEVDEGTEQDLEIEDMWIHSELDKRTRLNNDIAVVKVKSPGFEFNTWVLPACLPKSKEDKLPQNCTISGWGSNSNPGTGFARILHATWLEPLPRKTCESPFIYGDSLTEGMFCAGSLKGGPDSCQGDSGGPFLCPSTGGQLTLFGITSWGHGCGRSNSPGVYTNVPYYLDWINDRIKFSMMNQKST